MFGYDAIALFIAAALKFALAVPATVAVGYGFWESVLINTSGGIAGTLFFYLGSTRIMEMARRRRLLREHKRLRAGKEVKHRYFNRLNKLIIKVKHKIGIFGLALITPTVLGIPLGAIISAKFFKHNKLTLPILILSVVLWSLSYTAFSYFIKREIF
jgi:uncharacterized membrane protein